MAQVTGPLHSETASGQIAKATIFQHYNGKTYSKAYAVPGNTPGHDKMNQTPAQLAHQARFRDLAEQWAAATTAEKASWLPLALRDNVTPYNAFTKDAWERIAQGRTPVTYYAGTNRYRIYSGGTITPNPARWNPTWNGGGSLTFTGQEVYATENLETLQILSADNADGQLDFRGLEQVTTIDANYSDLTLPPIVRGLAHLTSLGLSTCKFTTPPDVRDCAALELLHMDNTLITSWPDLAGCPLLNNLAISATPPTTPPDLTANPALADIDISYTHFTTPPDLSSQTSLVHFVANHCSISSQPDYSALASLTQLDITTTNMGAGLDLTGLTSLLIFMAADSHQADVDTIFNWIANNLPHDRAGYVNLTGASNAPATAASAAARTALTAPSGAWALLYNT